MGGMASISKSAGTAFFILLVLSVLPRIDGRSLSIDFLRGAAGSAAKPLNFTYLEANVLEERCYICIIFRTDLMELSSDLLRIGRPSLRKHLNIVAIDLISYEELRNFCFGGCLVIVQVLGPFLDFFETELAGHVVDDEGRLRVVEIELR